MSDPLISVIIPVYNSEKYLYNTLKSLQRQTFEDFEAVCVDDGSSDDSPRILEQFAAEDARFKIKRQKNAGGSAARNKGLELAKGKFIAFLDNDDILHPQYLEILHKSITASDADISCCSYLRFEGEDDYIFTDFFVPTIDFISEQPFTDKFARKKKIEMLMWTKLYRRELFDDIRFATDLPAINDILLNIEILLNSKRAAVCRTPLIAYRLIATSQTLKELTMARIEEFKNLCADIGKLTAAYPQHKWLLQKIAARYAYGMHIKEYLERYNPATDTARYEKLRENLRWLQKSGYLVSARLGWRQRIALWAFIGKHFKLLKLFKK